MRGRAHAAGGVVAQGPCSGEVSPEYELVKNMRLQAQTLLSSGTPDCVALECFFHLQYSISTLAPPVLMTRIKVSWLVLIPCTLLLWTLKLSKILYSMDMHSSVLSDSVSILISSLFIV